MPFYVLAVEHIMASKKIFLCAGGTAGHVYPAIFVAQELEKLGYLPIIITDDRGSKYCYNYSFKKYIIAAKSPQQPTFIKKITALTLLFFGFLQSLYLIMIKQPQAIIGFGGYMTMPILCAGVVWRKKMMLHEQNAVLGKVNRIMANFMHHIYLSFVKTKFVPDKYHHKISFYGNPIRPIFRELSQQLVRKDDNFHIVIFGGSQGANFLSEICCDILKYIDDDIKKNLKLTIQTPKNYIDILYNTVQKYHINAIIDDFYHDLPSILHDADLVIARSGAATISELCALGKASILIPLPIAADNHQWYNAHFLEQNNAAILCEQKSLTAQYLWEKILLFYNDKNLLENYAESAKNLNNNYVAYHIAQHITTIIPQ